MKGYLFGLGAMLVGAGLMFVLMHERNIQCEAINRLLLESGEECGTSQLLFTCI